MRPVRKSDLNLNFLDFVTNRFFMKLIRTSSVSLASHICFLTCLVCFVRTVKIFLKLIMPYGLITCNGSYDFNATVFVYI